MITEIIENGKFYRVKCDGCGDERVYTRRCGKHRKFCSRKCINKGRLRTEESKHKTSEKMQGEKNHYYGKSHSKQTREKISEKSKEGFAKWSFERRKEFSDAQSSRQSGEGNSFYGKNHNEVTRKQMSVSRTKLVSSGLIAPVRGIKGVYVSSKTDNKEKYDSFYEMLWMKILDLNDNVKTWTKRHGVIIPYDFEGSRHYIPDFLIQFIDESKSLEEIKGYEKEEKLLAKINSGNAYAVSQNMTYKIILADELNEICKEKFGKAISQLRRDYQNGKF